MRNDQLFARSVVVLEPSDSRRSFRMQWGQLSWRDYGFAAKLCLFDEGRFSLNLHLAWLQLFLSLPFLRRWAWEPDEIMESWGFSTVDGAVHLNWGNSTKIVYFPWSDWVHISSTVMRRDGSFVPKVGSWEEKSERRPDGKESDGRYTEDFPYHYLLQSGETQHVTATVHVSRKEWRLRLLRWTSLLAKVRHYIEVEFSDEVGERSGSWKGGTLGCGYELKAGETPRQCLIRMMRDRKFR